MGGRLELLPHIDPEYASAGGMELAEEAVGFVSQRRIFVEDVVQAQADPGPIKRTLVEGITNRGVEREPIAYRVEVDVRIAAVIQQIVADDRSIAAVKS